MSEEALALLVRAMDRVRPRLGDILTLAYFAEFKEADGSPVAGFVPGYSPDRAEGPPRHHWILVRLPNGIKVPFWARESSHRALW